MEYRATTMNLTVKKPSRRRVDTLACVCIVVAAGASLVVAAPAAVARETHRLEGQIVLESDRGNGEWVATRKGNDEGARCSGRDESGFGDLTKGASVVVTSEIGTWTTTLSRGRAQHIVDGKQFDCVLPFSLSVVRSSSRNVTYTISISNRATTSWRRFMLDDDDWNVTIHAFGWRGTQSPEKLDQS